MNDAQKFSTPEATPAREAWETPELRQLEAAAAELLGLSGSDGPIGNPS